MDRVVTTVLLDLDGVLMDHAAASRRALHEWLGDRATPEVVGAWSASLNRWLAEWRAGAVSWEEQRRGRLRDVLPLVGQPVGTDDELDAAFASGYLAAYERSWRGFPDAAPAIAALHAAGIATAVLTNGSDRRQRAKLAAVGLLAEVGPVFATDALGLRKPDPRAFMAACERLDAEPADVLYVGDEHEIDVVGARSAGLHAVLLDRTGDGPPAETSVIRSLAELPPLLR